MGKICGKCKEDKDESKFHINQDWCKPCKSEHMRALYRTSRKYYLNNRYAAIKQRAEGRSPWPTGSKGLPFCTREEFWGWYEDTKEEFEKLWVPYVESGYNICLAPSVDRKDSNGGYEISNMAWLTQSDNSSKGNRD